MQRVALNRLTTRRLISSTSQGSSSFTFRRFFYKTCTGITLLYVAGLAVAVNNDDFEDFFTKKVPGGRSLVDSYNFGALYDLHEKSSEFYRNISSKITGKPIEIPRTLETNHTVFFNPISIKSPSGVTNPKFQEVLTRVNDFLNQLNFHQVSLNKSQWDEVLSYYHNLTKTIEEYNTLGISNNSKVINEEISKEKKLLNDKFEEQFQNKLNDLLDQFDKSSTTLRNSLEEKYANELKQNMEQSEQLLSEAHSNEVTMLSITQLKEFTNLIRTTLDEEREGRLAHIEQLNDVVNNLSNSVKNIDDLLLKNEIIKQLSSSLAGFKLYLHNGDGDLDAKKVNSIISKLIFLKRMLPKDLSIGCKHCRENQKICGCKSWRDKSQYPLLDVACSDLLNFQNNKTEVLSNEQLYNRWILLESDFKTASLLPPNPGFLGHLTAKVFSNLLFTKNGTTTDEFNPDDIYSNVKENLKIAKIDKALETVVELKGWPHILCEDWIKEARSRLELETLVDILNQEVSSL